MYNEACKPLFRLLEFNFLLLLTLACCPALGEDYVPTDNILLSCGGPPESTDIDDRAWYSDIGSKFASGIDKVSTTSQANIQKPSVPQVPYMHARIFHLEYTYNFPVTCGRKFIRLYFNLASYSGLDASNAMFSVTTGPYTLMKNFSAVQTSEALVVDYIKKEFSVNVQSQVLNLTFTPISNPSNNNSYAFVNGIEVISHPDIYNTEDGRVFIVGYSTPFLIDNRTAMENLYRLNVGGNGIPSSRDTGLFRSWEVDSIYIFGAAMGVVNKADPNVTITFPAGTPSYLAPLDVYETSRSMGPNPMINLNYNLTWLFSVDSGFFYLVRLHFCEGFDSIGLIKLIVFHVFLNNLTASTLDVIAMGETNGVALHKDYVVFVPAFGGGPQQDMWVALHPYIASKPAYYDAFLNGLEIFKVNDSGGNLGGFNPTTAPHMNIPPPNVNSICLSCTSHSRNKKRAMLGGGILCAVVLLALLVCAIIIYLRQRIHRAKESSNTKIQAASLGENLPNCRHFSLAEIKAATNNFDEALLLGVGGFGRVYRGEIDGGTKVVAIKRGNSLSIQGVNEFQNEIEILSKLRHRHLVLLIGCCQEDSEMILVYEYMANGTLREHLYKTKHPPLPWKQRLDSAIGAALGLHYLHTGAKHAIVHRDVKTTNILLDENWVAKVSDFGLSKTGPSLDDSHVSTNVKGTFGYLDPEYFRWRKLTTKSDVYSFGVVLFEILCGCPAVDPASEEGVGLAGWGRQCYDEGILHQIMDPYLKGKIAPECFEKIAETAVKCVADVGIARPSIGDVLRNLVLASQLQETAEHTSPSDGLGGALDLEQGSFGRG